MTLARKKDTYREPQSAKVLSFNQNYRKTYLGYDNLKRATAPDKPTGITSVIGEQAKKVVSVVSQKLKHQEIFICNLKYVSKTTRRKSRQSLNIIKELKGSVFKIEFYKKYEYKEKIYKNCYVFELLTKEENKLNIGKPYSQNDATSQSLQPNKHKGSKMPSFYNNIKRRNRSSESNILDDSFSSSEEKIQKQKPAKPQKIRKFYQNQYDKPKTLPEESPINDQEEAEIYKLSGRMYEKEAMNEILKDMVKRGLQKIFHSRRQFIVWFSKCMLNELRSVEHTNKVGFYIKGNKTQIEQEQIKTNAEQKIFLGSFEQTAIDLPCPENQLKAKWANVLPTNQGYNFLFNLKMMRLNKETLQIYLAKKIDLWDNTKHNILKEAKAVGDFMYTEKIEFIL